MNREALNREIVEPLKRRQTSLPDGWTTVEGLRDSTN